MRRCVITHGDKKDHFHLVFDELSDTRNPSIRPKVVGYNQMVPGYLLKSTVKKWVEQGLIEDRPEDDDIPF